MAFTRIWPRLAVLGHVCPRLVASTPHLPNVLAVSTTRNWRHSPTVGALVRVRSRSVRVRRCLHTRLAVSRLVRSSAFGGFQRCLRRLDGVYPCFFCGVYERLAVPSRVWRRLPTFDGVYPPLTAPTHGWPSLSARGGVWPNAPAFTRVW